MTTPGEIKIYDCNLNGVTASGSFAIIGDASCDDMQPAFAPSPPHDAAGVLLASPLSWTTVVPRYCQVPLGVGLLHNVFFGADPDPPQVGWMLDLRTFDPGLLQPNTRYYWRVDVFNSVGSATGPVWSFTTTDGTPTRRSTWGAIKALYR